MKAKLTLLLSFLLLVTVILDYTRFTITIITPISSFFSGANLVVFLAENFHKKNYVLKGDEE